MKGINRQAEQSDERSVCRLRESKLSRQAGHLAALLRIHPWNLRHETQFVHERLVIIHTRVLRREQFVAIED